jgi:cytochrome c peroxidase
MGMPDGETVAGKLRADGGYRALFARAFPGTEEAVTFDNYAVAIAAFERTLITRSRWDEFLEGNAAALTVEEKRGLKTFLNVGCMTCHTGKLLGGRCTSAPALPSRGRTRRTSDGSPSRTTKATG